MIISFFTENTIYEREVEDLLSSCRSLDLEHHIASEKDLGSWEKNCCQKPRFILESLKKFQKPLLWVDADAMILRKPSIDAFQTFDIGFYFQEEMNRARAGTIYVAPTKAAFDFLEKWDRTCQERLSIYGELPGADQAILNELLKEETKLKVAELPLAYVRIFDRDPLSWEETVILHFQASRTALMNPLLWKHLTGRDLKHLRMSQRQNLI